MSDIGWISIHRKIAGHWVWEGKPFSYGQAWIDILLECNHGTRKQLIKNRLITTNRGQSSNSVKTWAGRFGWNYDATRHFIELLKSDNMVTTESAGVTTILTVCNYDTYQDGSQSKAKQKPIETQTEPKQNPTNNNDNNGINENNGVLGAHTAFINISSKKPTNHELMQITNLCHQYTPIVVIGAIAVMGDRSWHSVGTLKKVLTGELPKPEDNEVIDDMPRITR